MLVVVIPKGKGTHITKFSASQLSPRFFVIVKPVVLGDPAVHLDATPLLLSEKPSEERPGHLQRVCLVHRSEESLG